MTKSVVVLLHAAFWACYLMMVMIFLGILFQNDANETHLENAIKGMFWFAILPSALSFYSFYFLLFPKYLQNKKIPSAILYGMLISLGTALFGHTVISTFDNLCKNEDVPFYWAIIFMTLISLISGVIALVIKGFVTWFGEIKLKEALRQKNHEMELALIKSQLDPHFLFNTINNIDVLILKNATEASNYLNKLSDIMRFMLYETKADQILLSKEIEYIEKYIELQKIRTSNLNYVNFLVTGLPDHKTIAPMLFIPFIENAFKHTINKKLANAITIHILIKQESIHFVCENRFNPNLKKAIENNGLGNDLIQKRLNLIYPHRHKLEVMKQNDLYSVHLQINNG